MEFRKFIRYRIETGKRGLLTRPADEWDIAFHQGGMVITHHDFRPFLAKGVSECRVAWSNVERVFAGQTDNLTWDTIWITFVLNDGSTYSVPETATDWDRLLEQILANLPKALHKQEWFPHVTRTAFEPNITQLYPVST